MSNADKIAGYVSALKHRLRLPVNARNQVLGGQGGQFVAHPLVEPLGVVTTAEQLDLYLGLEQDFVSVFNDWTRISRPHNGTGDNHLPAEVDAWQVDTQNNRVICTVNSSSIVGFISDLYYEDYVIEAYLSSTDSDDDAIGICVAYAIDPLTGLTHTLNVFRTFNGHAPLTIGRNTSGMGGPASLYTHVIQNGLKWVDGTVATTATTNGQHQGWGALGPTDVKLYIRREGDLITVKVNNPGESAYFEPATVEFDLKDYPQYEVFRGPQRFGYIAHSQRYATWDILQSPALRTPFFATYNDTYYNYDQATQAWVSYPGEVNDQIAADRLRYKQLYQDPLTRKFHLMRPYALEEL